MGKVLEQAVAQECMDSGMERTEPSTDIPKTPPIRKFLELSRYVKQVRKATGMTEEEQRTLDSLRLFYTASKNFALPATRLPSEVRADVARIYNVSRLVDEVVDARSRWLSFDYKHTATVLNGLVDVMMEDDPSGSDIEAVNADLAPYIPYIKDAKHRRLVRETPTIIRAMGDIPSEARGRILDWTRKMIEGFTNPDVDKIRTPQDHRRYMYYAAVVTGYKVLVSMQRHNYLNEEDMKRLVPEHGFIPGNNPANHFAYALQMNNDLKDVRVDHRIGIHRWPQIYLERHGLTFDSLLKPRGRERYSAFRVRARMHKDTVEMARKGCVFVDELPRKPYVSGLRAFSGIALMSVAASLRQKPKRTMMEVMHIDDVVKYLSGHGESMAPYMEHLLTRGNTSQTYCSER